MTFPILVCGSYLLRHFCDVTNKACFRRFNAIFCPIKTPYFRNNFRRNGQKIDVSADIIPGSLTLLTGFVILDLTIIYARHSFSTLFTAQFSY